MSADMKKKAIRGGLWSFVENAGTQLVVFVVFVALANLLQPASAHGFLGSASPVTFAQGNTDT